MDPVRALGIDIGEARIGVAGTDAIGLLAHPVETIHVRSEPNPVGRIAELAEARRVDVVVVGLPLRMDGSRGTAAEKAEKFAARIRAALPDVDVEMVDERLSTVTAQERLHASGRNVKNSRHIIDQAAAVVILQDWMDARGAN